MLRILGLSVIALTALAGLANAGPYNDVIRQDVALHYRSGDLQSEAGARAMLMRISMAARQACGGSVTVYSSYSWSPSLAHREFEKCQAEAITRAVQSLNNPAVSRLSASADAQALRFAGR